ncbi:DUF3726 domain-containing protein [Sulfitobacter aestuarii]|uniref:DUF3726 domain-containing protein n=1 Tax=Sulfitobacter aestuarii TaxID=2161676 RepID=A0ABW5TWK8_9RHOB
MICSLNEIEALSRKAARGGGLSWGLAEEAGKAVRWLCDAGFPGARLLVALLQLNDGKEYAELVPQLGDGIWQTRGGRLCPVIAGSLICDRADMLRQGEALLFGDTALPLLLAPFAAEAARLAEVSVVLEWPGARLSLGQGATLAEGDAAALEVACAGPVTLSRGARQGHAPAAGDVGRRLDTVTLGALEAFAQRTYAPATEASRAGAGAGQDND